MAAKRWILVPVEEYLLKRAKPRLKDYGFDSIEEYLRWAIKTLANVRKEDDKEIG